MDAENRSPVKTRMPKSFKFLHKKDKDRDEKEKEERRKGKEEKKEERKKEKEEKLRAKEEKKRSKKEKKKHIEPYVEDSACVVFGVPLLVAVDRSPCHDGVRLPVLVRQCIDYVEEHGIECEGIYRLSGVKSKVQNLRRQYNSAATVSLDGQDPHVVASLLKQFLRELPEQVLTTDMTSHFEDASQIPGWRERADAIRQLLHRLPTPNSQLVHYVLAHMGHIIDREIVTKMNFQNVCIVLSPTMRISHRVLNVFFQSHSYLFGDVQIKRYTAPVCSSSAVESVVGVGALLQEVTRQEAVLAHLHKLLAASPHNTIVQERLWEAQRILTLLKRAVKMSQREAVRSDDASSEESQRESCSEATNTNNSTSILTSDSQTLPPPEAATTDTAALPSQPETQSTPPPSDTRARRESEPKMPSIRPSNQDIPKLPKPVSARDERYKLTSKKSLEMANFNVDETSVITNNKSQELCFNIDESSSVTRKRSFDTTISNIDETCSTTSTAPLATGVSSVNVGRKVSENGSFAPLERPSEANVTVISEERSAGYTARPTARQPICVDAELVRLAREEAEQLAQHAELLAMSHDLGRKLAAERAEIARLKEEIQEVQTLYGYRTYSYDSSESGGESESGGGGGDSDTEEELQQQLHLLHKHNGHLQRNNGELIQRIQVEREAVVLLKAKLRQTQATSLHNPDHHISHLACY